MTTAACDRSLRWLVVTVFDDDRTLLGAGPTALFGVASLTSDNSIHVRAASGKTITAPAGRVNPAMLAKAMLCRIHARREMAWW